MRTKCRKFGCPCRWSRESIYLNLEINWAAELFADKKWDRRLKKLVNLML